MELEKYLGYMILPENTILYHSTNDKDFKISDYKPFIFTNFHPQEWIGNYVVKIKLIRNIKILFMIDYFDWRHNLISALPKLINDFTPNSDLNKQTDCNLLIYRKHLENNDFDGWFCSVEDGYTTEIALLNNFFFEIIECTKIVEEDYNNTKQTYDDDLKCNIYEENPIYDDELNNIKTIINFGNYYELSFIKNKVKFYLNDRYKNKIENIKNMIKQKYIYSVFHKLLMHSDIVYFFSDCEIKNYWI